MRISKRPKQLASPYGTITLYRNQHGVPVVSAPNDLAMYYGQGWVQMCDRQLQAHMLKIIFTGRAAEFLGKDLIPVDEYIRSFPFLPDPDEQLSAMRPDARAALEAFTEGCNAWFSSNKPRWEWRLAGVQIEDFSSADVLSILNGFGFIGLTDTHIQTKRFIIQMLQNGVSPQQVKELFPRISEEIDLELIQSIRLGPSPVPPEIAWYVPSFSASNNWVVSDGKGSALLANDPHLHVTRLPAIWQEIVLESDGRCFKGFSIPGLIGAIVGRSPDLAWGPTYSFLDMLEYRIEEVRDCCVRRGDDWLPLHQRSETIAVRKQDPVVRTYWESDHGLLEGFNENNLSDGYYLSLGYSAAKHVGGGETEAVVDIFHARTTEEGLDIYRKLESPSFCWAFADTQGTIGYRMTGRAIQRDPGNSGLIPHPAWNTEPMSFLPAEDMPLSCSSSAGRIVTANNNLTAGYKTTLQSAPMPSYRADRIEQLLQQAEDYSVETMRTIQLDLYSLQAEAFMKHILPLLPDHPNAVHLRDWNCCYSPESVGAVYFERFYCRIIEYMFFTRQMGGDVFSHLWDESGLFVTLHGHFDAVILAESSSWCSEEERRDWIRQALRESLSQPPIQMQKFRRSVMRHVLFGSVLPSWLGFDHGPVHFPGSRATVNQGQFYRSGGMDTSFCPSLRLITDMQSDTVHTNLAGGISDRRFSSLYLKGLDLYLQGKLKTT
ncbi:penicillin acylase family protein [Spirochaeta dissipatitropha]